MIVQYNFDESIFIWNDINISNWISSVYNFYSFLCVDIFQLQYVHLTFFRV